MKSQILEEYDKKTSVMMLIKEYNLGKQTTIQNFSLNIDRSPIKKDKLVERDTSG